jgi:3-hydroxyisobutyrate dehydrogenase
MKVGYAGLGNLGRAMAERLLAEGVDLTVWNRTPEKAEGLGAPVASSAADLMSAVDVCFVCVRDERAVEELAYGPDGLLTGACAGKVVVDCSTNRYDAAPGFRRQFANAQVSYVEAPVLGSVVPARSGQLTVLVCGEDDAYERVEPLLRTIGSRVDRFPEAGQPTRMKLVANYVMGTIMAAIADGVALGESAGLDRAQVLDILASGPGRSMVMEGKRPKIESGDFSPHFAAALVYKDLGYAGELSRDLHRPFFLGDITRDLYALTFGLGRGDDDLSVIYEAVRRL